MGLIYVRITSIFSFPTHTRAHFARQITKRLQNIFNVVTNKRQNWNTERIMQFFRIAAYVQIARLYGLVHYAVCAFCHICTACGLLLWVWPIKLLMQSLAVWALRERECECVWRFYVFVIVDVKYIIHYRRMCKFICSL